MKFAKERLEELLATRSGEDVGGEDEHVVNDRRSIQAGGW
jgi:hypothetical protein